MRLNSEIILSPNTVKKQSPYRVKKMSILFAGFIGVSFLTVGFFNLSQLVRIHYDCKSSQFIQEMHCRCGNNCSCGTSCGCK